MDRSLRVLTVVRNLGPGGTQRAAQNYTLGYGRAGVPVAVLAYDTGGVRESRLWDNNVETFVGPDAEAAARAWGATLIHIHRDGPSDPQTAGILRRLRNAPSAPRVIETNVFGRADWGPDRALIDVHLHLSRWCLWRWRRWTRRLRPSPIGAVVPYAVETDRFRRSSEAVRDAFRARLGIPSSATLFGRIGQPSIWKWHPSLFKAFERVATAHPDAYLLVVGLPSELESSVDGLAPDIRRRVVSLPFLHGDEALREGYSSIDVFVHASEIGETFGMVLAESMLCGTPVVTLSRPVRDNSQLEVVGHEIGGLVAAHPRDLAVAMSRLAADSVERTRLGCQGAERIAERFALPVVMDTLLRIARQTVEASSREALVEELTSAPDLVTDVPNAEIRRLLTGQIGRPHVVELAQQALLHRPEVYAAWSRWKFGTS